MNWLYEKLEDLLHALRIKKYERDVFFKVLDDEPHGLLPVEILKGTFKGTRYTITGIQVLDDYGKTQYDFQILKSKPKMHLSAYTSDAFYKLVGEIMVVCLEEFQTNRVNLRNEVLSDEVDPSYYSEEPTPQRAISKKSAALSKA